MKMNFEYQIQPFFWVEHEKSFSLCLEVGEFLTDVLEARADEGFEGGGYDWASLAQVYLDEMASELSDLVQFDPEASMFVAYSAEEEPLRQFALGFKEACDDDTVIRDLFSRAELD